MEGRRGAHAGRVDGRPATWPRALARPPRRRPMEPGQRVGVPCRHRLGVAGVHGAAVEGAAPHRPWSLGWRVQLA
eukprot:13064413-Alexandrium_andersonii.AAC.1